jgi:hypothetical protein
VYVPGVIQQRPLFTESPLSNESICNNDDDDDDVTIYLKIKVKIM